MENIVKQLTSRDRLYPPSYALKKGLFKELDRRGIYAWFFKELPYERIPTGECYYTEDGYFLLYIGIAPSLIRGEPSRQNLRRRLRLHYFGNIQGSTLRKSLACLLKDKLSLEFREGVDSRRPKLTRDSRHRLTKWLDKNALISWTTEDEPWLYEVELILKFKTPLNLDCNMHHPFYRELSKIRTRVLAEASKT